MQIRWPRNPRTPDGWFKRIAIALLVGLAAFGLTLPLSFFLFLNHFESTYPKDNQNMLSAVTASVVLSLALGAMGTAATLLGSLLYKRLGVTARPVL